MKHKDNGTNMPFSPAELSVVEQLSRGYSEKEISDRLHLSFHTVNNHLRNIREKHHLQKNTEIIILYAAYLSKKSISLQKIKELGLAILFIFVNICDYTRMLL